MSIYYARNLQVINCCKLKDKKGIIAFGQSKPNSPANGSVDKAGKVKNIAKEKLFEWAKRGIQSSAFHKICDIAGKNPPLFSAGVVLAITTTLRPAAILAVPGAKKEDKEYSAARSFATGIIAFCMALVMYRPLELLIRRLGKAALSNPNYSFPYVYGSNEFEKFNYLATQTANVIIAPFQSMLLMKFIPPIVRKIFPDNGSEPKPTPDERISAMLLNGDVYKKFMGRSVK